MDEIKVLDGRNGRCPEHGPRRGEVEQWKDGAYEVEFSDDSGEAYAFRGLAPDQLMKLHFRRDEAA